MANLKSLKIRIKSVKSTQKITKAMKMVSASKLRRAREKAEAAAPYSERMARMLSALASNISKESAPKLLVGNGSDKVHLLVVVSTDRGLCGGFNGHITKAVKREISKIESSGKKVKLFTVGKKAYELLRHSYPEKIVHHVDGISRKKTQEFSDALAQSNKIIEMFENGEFDVCSIFYNKFVSAISQIVTKQQLIPLQLEKEEKTSDSIYEFEPSEGGILNELLPKNLAVQVFHAFLENSASEHGARMTAMDNATRNAGEMIKKLTLKYNRTRQAAITTELTEIISGAEAL